MPHVKRRVGRIVVRCAAATLLAASWCAASQAPAGTTPPASTSRAIPSSGQTHPSSGQAGTAAASRQAKRPPATITQEPAEVSTTVAHAWKVFADSETDKRPARRAATLLALGNAGDRPEAVRLLANAMEDPRPEIRRAAAAALGLARARATIPRLQQALDDPSPSVRVAAARSLWQMKDYSGTGLFERIITLQAPLGETGAKVEWQKAVTKAEDPSYMFVLGLHEGAGALLGPYALAIPLYTYLSADRGVQGRAAIAAMLGDRRTDDAVAALEIALVDQSPVVRAAAAIALGKSERPDEITHLGPLLHDKKQVVRLAAAAAVARLSPAGSGDTATPPGNI